MPFSYDTDFVCKSGEHAYGMAWMESKGVLSLSTVWVPGIELTFSALVVSASSAL